MWAYSEGSGETVWMRRLTWAFAVCICDKYPFHMGWVKCCLLCTCKLTWCAITQSVLHHDWEWHCESLWKINWLKFFDTVNTIPLIHSYVETLPLSLWLEMNGKNLKSSYFLRCWQLCCKSNRSSSMKTRAGVCETLCPQRMLAPKHNLEKKCPHLQRAITPEIFYGICSKVNQVIYTSSPISWPSFKP